MLVVKKQLYHVCPPVRKIVHSLKLADYLYVQADNPWYNYFLVRMSSQSQMMCVVMGRQISKFSIACII